MSSKNKCMTCRYALRDPAATPDQIIAGQVPYLCWRMPPSASSMMLQQGGRTGLATVTAYPQVTAATLSCGEYKEQEAANGSAA